MGEKLTVNVYIYSMEREGIFIPISLSLWEEKITGLPLCKSNGEIKYWSVVVFYNGKGRHFSEPLKIGVLGQQNVCEYEPRCGEVI